MDCSPILACRKPMKTIPNARCALRWRSPRRSRNIRFGSSDGSIVRLGVRIGVNTGVVVVGSVPGEPPDRREVFGSSAHVAARLQGLASENGVVVGASTYELTRGTFSYTPLGRQPLKGVEEPVRPDRVEAIASSESRFDRAQRSPSRPDDQTGPAKARCSPRYGSRPSRAQVRSASFLGNPA